MMAMEKGESTTAVRKQRLTDVEAPMIYTAVTGGTTGGPRPALGERRTLLDRTPGWRDDTGENDGKAS